MLRSIEAGQVGSWSEKILRSRRPPDADSSTGSTFLDALEDGGASDLISQVTASYTFENREVDEQRVLWDYSGNFNHAGFQVAISPGATYAWFPDDAAAGISTPKPGAMVGSTLEYTIVYADSTSDVTKNKVITTEIEFLGNDVDFAGKSISSVTCRDGVAGPVVAIWDVDADGSIGVTSWDDTHSNTWTIDVPAVAATEPDFSAGYPFFDGADDYMVLPFGPPDGAYAAYAEVFVHQDGIGNTNIVFSCRPQGDVTEARGELRVNGTPVTYALLDDGPEQAAATSTGDEFVAEEFGFVGIERTTTTGQVSVTKDATHFTATNGSLTDAIPANDWTVGARGDNQSTNPFHGMMKSMVFINEAPAVANPEVAVKAALEAARTLDYASSFLDALAVYDRVTANQLVNAGNAVFALENSQASSQRGLIDDSGNMLHVGYEPLLIPAAQDYIHIPFNTETCAFQTTATYGDAATEEHVFFDAEFGGVAWSTLDIIGPSLQGFDYRLRYTGSDFVVRRKHSGGDSDATIADTASFNSFTGRRSIRVSMDHGASPSASVYYSDTPLTGSDPMNDVTWTLIGTATPAGDGVGTDTLADEWRVGLNSTSSVEHPVMNLWRLVYYENGATSGDIALDLYPDEDITDYSAAFTGWSRIAPTVDAAEPDFSLGTTIDFDGTDDRIITRITPPDNAHAVWLVGHTDAFGVIRTLVSSRKIGDLATVTGELNILTSWKDRAEVYDEAGDEIRVASVATNSAGSDAFHAYERQAGGTLIQTRNEAQATGTDATVADDAYTPSPFHIGNRDGGTWWLDGEIKAVIFLMEAPMSVRNAHYVRQALNDLKGWSF